MIKYPVGVQDFASLRRDGFAYVDKTAFVYKIAHSGRCFFLSRPRRFGKSLLLSTLKSYYLGQKELFRGLAIEKLETEWTPYAVLYLDLNSGKYSDAGSLRSTLHYNLTQWEAEYGANPVEDSFAMRFTGVIKRAAEKSGHRVVVLVDEYDKPMLQTIADDELQAAHRAELKAFYSVLKTMDGYIKCAFLTGVTKFGKACASECKDEMRNEISSLPSAAKRGPQAKVSVFSDLNNLQDLSLNPYYADICGLTEQEIRDNFAEGIAVLAERNGLDFEQCVVKMRERYDGYHFVPGGVGLYNPFSVLGALSASTFNDFWFATGTPTFLMEVLKRTNYNLFHLLDKSVTVNALDCIDPIRTSPVPVIYQSGYLTIKSYNPEARTYRLDFPNGEVREGFLTFMLPYFTPREEGEGADMAVELRNAVRDGHPDEFMQLLQDFFDAGDYRVEGDHELYFQNSLFLIFRLLGVHTQVEMATARGRIDLVAMSPRFIYVVELKRDATPEAALQQIEQRGYARKYAADGRKVYKIGVNFSTETRGITGWKVEE